jgi:hypothetical protein
VAEIARTATPYLIGKLAAGSGEVRLLSWRSYSDPSACQTIASTRITIPSRMRSGGRYGSFQNLIFESDAFGIVFLEPFFGGVRGGEDLQVILVANLLCLCG